MKKRKAIKWTIIFIVLLILIYFGVNGVNLYSYKFNKSEYYNITKNLAFKDTMKITKSTPLNPDEYLSFKNVKVKNYFKDFKEAKNLDTSGNSVKYVLYNDDNKLIASFWITISETLTTKFKSNLDIDNKEIDKLKEVNRENFLKKNNIRNDIDLFKFLESKKDINNNIFTNINEMKENYLISNFVESNVPEVNNITLIDGDYDGYIFKITAIGTKEYNLIYSGKIYSFTFIGTDYFSDDYINEILNTVIIE